MLSYIMSFLTTNDQLNFSATSRACLKVIRITYKLTRNIRIPINIIQKLNSQVEKSDRSTIFLLSPVRVLFRRLKILDCKFVKLKSQTLSILSIYALALEKIWLRKLSISGLSNITMFSSLSSLTLGSVGLGHVNVSIIDYHIIMILRSAGKKLKELSLIKLLSLTPLTINEIGIKCINLKELTIFSCPRIFVTQFVHEDKDNSIITIEEPPNDNIIATLCDRLSLNLKVLDLRYSADIDDQILDSLKLSSCYLQRYVSHLNNSKFDILIILLFTQIYWIFNKT